MRFNFFLVAFQLLSGIGVVATTHANSQYGWFSRPLSAHRPKESTIVQRIPRSGSIEEDTDEERYSRQVYTLGARAHGLIRSATVFVDCPATSGLAYEAVKNLALSGIGRIIIVTSKEEVDANYHNPRLDDLGQTYLRGAREELGLKSDDDTSNEMVLVEFLRRLNPSLEVGITTRDELDKDSLSSGTLLCIDRPYCTQLQLNELCRKYSSCFVAAETAGVHGRAFSDFGPNFEVHDADGETPLVVPIDSMEIEDSDSNLFLLRSVEGERHDVSKGDEIQFQLSNGDIMDVSCNVVKVKTPQLVVVEMVSPDIDAGDFLRDVNEIASSFSRKKKIEIVSFVSLKEAVSNIPHDPSLFTPCDLDKSFDDVRKDAVFRSFQALDAFVTENSRLPTASDLSKFLDMVIKKESSVKSTFSNHCKLFASKCAAKFVPLQGVFGAIAAQECLKASSGLYNPINQFLLYDCDEVISSSHTEEENTVSSSKSGLAYILGDKIVAALEDKRLFVVGSGAIGCEILKNLAAMGAGTGEKGSIILTDMDTIEKSNLSRQLLFRDGDISKFKSKAAEEATKRLNPEVKIESHTNKVGDDELGPFDSKFWSRKVDVVLNALDNIDARLYMDGQCVANEKALVDAGTLGSKGNVQVVIPHMSESYGSSPDPPEPAIPVCTLKNFPYLISHTIQWGRDLFDGLYVRRPTQANKYGAILMTSSLMALQREVERDVGDQAALETARELASDLLVFDGEKEGDIRQKAIAWSVELANDLFCCSIEALLKEHPPGSFDEDGEPFWSGARKEPVVLRFSNGEQLDTQQETVNENLINFVRFAARLRIESYLGESASSAVSFEEARDALLASRHPETTTEAEMKVDDYLEPLEKFTGLDNELYVAEFEKDDDSNGHIAFITAASNLRALCYGIPVVDEMETRRVAGRIVPAMITTTAFVSALSCTELIKLVQGAPLNQYRNAFINLALPFFAFTAPLPAEEMQGVGDTTYTLWDRLTIKESKKVSLKGGLTLRKLLKRLVKKASNDSDSIQVASITFGQYMIYASFLHEDEDEILNKNLWAVVNEAVVSGNDFDSEFSRDTGAASDALSTNQVDSAVLDLTVIVEDTETGEETELPPVRVIRYSED